VEAKRSPSIQLQCRPVQCAHDDEVYFNWILDVGERKKRRERETKEKFAINFHELLAKLFFLIQMQSWKDEAYLRLESFTLNESSWLLKRVRIKTIKQLYPPFCFCNIYIFKHLSLRSKFKFKFMENVKTT